MEGRKRVIVDCDETVELVRVGDISTKCLAVAEKTAEYNGEFVLKNNEFFADTTAVSYTHLTLPTTPYV